MIRVTHEFEIPSEHHLKHLAPRVEGINDFAGRYGYALCLDAKGLIDVMWDEDGRGWISADQIVFLG
jgi:hypothetical protein